MQFQNDSNNVVWAKLRYCPYWPSRIVDPLIELKKKAPPRKFCVFFFGSKNYGFVPIENVESYVQNRSKYVKRGRGNGFNDAVKECDDFLANDSAIRIDDTTTVDNEIIVKHELDFVVKQENVDKHDSFLCSREVVKIISHAACNECNLKQIDIDELKNERKKLIDDLSAAKQDCQTYYLDLQKNERSLVKFKEDYNALTLDFSKQKFELENQIKCLNEQNKIYCQQNQRLKSQIKKLKTNDEFEVEAIIGHKGVNRDKIYLVRWKGYDESENTWEREENLKCPKILNKYKKLNKLS